MADRIHSYTSDDIEVRYELKRCIHAAECVRRLPRTFNPERRPWVDPEASEADRIAEAITHCPTGALHFVRRDDGPEEQPDSTNSVSVDPDGPLYVRGDIVVMDESGETIVEDVRVALCRCGLSSNKPFCDRAHVDGGFADQGTLGEGGLKSSSALPPDRLEVAPSKNGPFVIRGKFRLRGSDGEEREGDVAAFCRCGHSSNKPFCDGTHRKVDFRS